MATFLVVLGHSIIVFPIDLHEVAWCKYLYNIIYSFHMPLFFAISGFCYSYKGKYFSYLLKKAKRLLIPYIFFCGIKIATKIAFPQYVNKDIELEFGIISEIIFHGFGYWFLYTMFILFAVFPIIEKALKKNTYLTCAVVIIFSLLSEYAPSIFRISNVLYFMPFFTFGYVLKRNGTEKIKKFFVALKPVWKVFIVILGIAILMLNGYLHDFINYPIAKLLEAIAAIAICVVFVWIFPNIFRVFGRFSAYSLPLYLFNGYLLVISRTITVSLLGINNAIVIIAFNLIVDFFLSYLILKYIIAKIPFCRLLMGIA